jgi:hypothetical protein
MVNSRFSLTPSLSRWERGTSPATEKPKAPGKPESEKSLTIKTTRIRNLIGSALAGALAFT